MHRRQLAVACGNGALDGTAGERKIDAAGCSLDEQLSAAVAGGVVGLQSVRNFIVVHQGLPANTDVHRAIGLCAGLDVGQLRQILQVLLPLVQQIVGGSTTGFGGSDLSVQLGYA